MRLGAAVKITAATSAPNRLPVIVRAHGYIARPAHRNDSQTSAE